MMPNRTGTFNARRGPMGVSESESGLAQVTINFELLQEMTADGPADVAAENMSIVGYFYVEKKDGTLNDNAIKTLRDVIGWDGRSLDWFSGAPEGTAENLVQVVLEFENYKGKDRIKVKYLNPLGYEGGGVKRGDAATLKKLASRLGSKLRAYSGGSPAPAPAATGVPKAAPPKAPAKAAAPVAAASAATATADEAWAAILAVCEGHNDAEQQWFLILADLFPGRGSDTLTPAEWAEVKAKGPGLVPLPF